MKLSRCRIAIIALLSVLIVPLVLPSAAGAQATSPYVRTAIVSPVPGNAGASGQNLLSALASIQGAARTNRWLLKIEPGIYHIGTASFEMKPYVDVEGSGIGSTVIEGIGQDSSGGLDFTIGVVEGADNAKLSELTVSCLTTAQNDACIAVANDQVSPTYTRVKVVATTPEGGGSRWGFRNTEAHPILDHVEFLIANGFNNYGVVNASGSRPQITHSFIKVVQGTSENSGILNHSDGSPSLVEDTTIQVRHAPFVHGIRDFDDGVPGGPMVLRRTDILADNASTASYGVRGGLNALVVEHSKIDARGTDSHAVYRTLGSAYVNITHSELIGSETLVQTPGTLSIGSTWLRNGGAITAAVERCAAVYTSVMSFFPNTCP